MAYRFEIFKDNAGQHRWRFKSGNGEIVAQSEAYVSKSGAENGARVLQQNAGGAAIEDLTAVAASRW
jgi:uncharacterized protein YegP (UPF0339 family)